MQFYIEITFFLPPSTIFFFYMLAEDMHVRHALNFKQNDTKNLKFFWCVQVSRYGASSVRLPVRLSLSPCIHQFVMLGLNNSLLFEFSSRCTHGVLVSFSGQLFERLFSCGMWTFNSTRDLVHQYVRKLFRKAEVQKWKITWGQVGQRCVLCECTSFMNELTNEWMNEWMNE